MYKWKIGVATVEDAGETSPLLLHGSITDNLRTAARLGFQAIEIHTRENEAYDYRAIRDCMEETGVEVSQIATGKLTTEGLTTLMDDRPYVEKACLDALKAYVDMASQLGAGIILGWARGNVPAGRKPGPYMRRLAQNLSVLNEYSLEKNVPVNIEAINHYEMNNLNTSRQMVDFLTEYELSNCYVHLDTYHMLLEETSMADAVRTAGKKLGYLHLADSTRWYPGSGEIQFRPIFEALDEIGYRGYISIECFPHGDGVETARKGLACVKSILEDQ